MEKLSEQEKADFTAGLRAASNQGEETYKVVAVLRALGDDIPKNVSINGADIRKLVADLEARGLVIPGRGISDIEVRSLRGNVVQQMPRITLRGIPYKTKAPAATYNYDPDEALRMKAKIQEQTFDLLLAMEGDSQEKLEARLEEERDPLMKLVNARNPKRK